MTKQFRLTVKGQVTIPKDVRDSLGLKPGDLVAFERAGDRAFVRKGGVSVADDAARREDMRARIKKATAFAIPLTDMTTDEYMAMIREPLPLSAE